MHQTKVRPRTEPYDIWCARRKMQRKAIDRYIKYGTPIWRSNILINTNKNPAGKPRLKSVVLQGTYRNECVLCRKHVKKCKCSELLED